MSAKNPKGVRAVKASERMALLISILLDCDEWPNVNRLCDIIEQRTGKRPVFSTVWRDIWDLEKYGFIQRHDPLVPGTGVEIEILLQREPV